MNDAAQTAMIVSLIIIAFIQQARINRCWKAIEWFAKHIRIDDRDLEKSPIPDDLLELLDEPDEN